MIKAAVTAHTSSRSNAWNSLGVKYVVSLWGHADNHRVGLRPTFSLFVDQRVSLGHHVPSDASADFAVIIAAENANAMDLVGAYQAER